MPKTQQCDRLFKLLLLKIQKERGFDFTQYRLPCLKRRIDARLKANHVAGYLEYIHILNHNPEEYDKLLDAATINVTEFFRDPGAWRAVKNKILPEIINSKEKRRHRIIRIWSAGTSGGEEAYTLSILLHEILGPRINDFLVKVIGTDIDEGSLARAELGEYQPESVRRVDINILNNYFNFTGNSYAISDRIRLITRFKPHNMITEPPLEHVDFITCRNVMIYFSRDLQAKLIQNFNKALHKRGFLMIGKSESLWGAMTNYFDVADGRERIYQKR